MKSKQLNVRLPAYTQKQIEVLASRLGMTKTQIIILAIDRLTTKEQENG